VNLDRQQTPIQGAKEDQQKRADQFRAVLAKDSTNVEAHVGLGDVLYDTGNWSDAIVEYRAALRRDSTLTSTLVDLGVCYFNLGRADDAQDLFQRALVREPHQPIALFNMGIVNESAGNNQQALDYFHKAIENHPPPDMQKALAEAVNRVSAKLGKKPPPLAP
jgi:tetratricopeptide (TPR) repeat protein